MTDPGVATIDPHKLRIFRADEAATGSSAWVESLPLAGHSLQAIERAAIKQTLKQAGGNKALAARTLGIAVSTLYEKLKKLDLESCDSVR
jgi:DNA-binding NtrC family response regulator